MVSIRVAVEGLDLSGKSTVAKYLVDSVEGFDYIKVSKGDLFDYNGLETEKEINGRIMEEMAAVVEDRDDIIMDRAAVSTAATGEIFDPRFSYQELIEQEPDPLIPDLGVVITISEDTLEKRISNTELTAQDEKVVDGDYFDVQKRMLNDVEDEYIHIRNNYDELSDLYEILDQKVVPTLESDV